VIGIVTAPQIILAMIGHFGGRFDDALGRGAGTGLCEADPTADAGSFDAAAKARDSAGLRYTQAVQRGRTCTGSGITWESPRTASPAARTRVRVLSAWLICERADGASRVRVHPDDDRGRTPAGGRREDYNAVRRAAGAVRSCRSLAVNKMCGLLKLRSTELSEVDFACN